MSKTMLVTLDEHCTTTVQHALSKGKYKNAVDVIHEAMALFEKKEAEERLHIELQKGMESGFDHNFHFPDWLQEVKQRYK